MKPFLIAVPLLLLAGCGDAPNPQANRPAAPPVPPNPAAGLPIARDTLPDAPFAIPRPKAPAVQQVGGNDLAKMEVGRLKALARKAAESRSWPEAATLQYFAATKAGDGYYDLACYCFQSQRLDDGLHWLQVAAREDGVDPEWAGEDADLANLRADGRWAKTQTFLNECRAYWQAHGPTVTRLVLPEGYKKGTPIPAVVWLHGMGSSPDDFASGDEAQDWADQLKFAIVGVSGTRPLGKTSFVWAEDRAADVRRIEAALAEVAGRVTLKPGKLVALGFSQGALVAGVAAAALPDRFAGAIALSPGGKREPPLPGRDPARHGKLRFVVSVGGGEMLGNRLIAKSLAGQLRGLGATVEDRVVAEQRGHSFPPDFEEKFPQWVAEILKDR